MGVQTKETELLGAKTLQTYRGIYTGTVLYKNSLNRVQY